MRSLTLVLMLALAALPAAAVMSPSDVDRAAIDAVFSDYDRTDSPGCALGVVHDGRLVYARGYGMANLDYGLALSPRSIFRIGSTSKQFTAATMLLLHQQGELDLDADVRTYLPQLQEYERPVTVRQLVHHTSGYRDYLTLWSLAGQREADWASDAEALDLLSRQRELNFEPGTDHMYSNSGYFLLSQIVAAATGSTLREVAQREIFGPLGMEDSHFHDDHKEIVRLRATGYAPLEEGGFEVSVTNLDMVGDGGVFTSIEDLARWDAALYDPSPLGDEGFIETLHGTAKLPDGEDTEYAFGLIVEEHRGLRRVSHGGAFVGYRANLIRFPDQRLSVICLCNRADTRPTGLAQQVADLYLADEYAEGTEGGTSGGLKVTTEAANFGFGVEQLEGAYYDADQKAVSHIARDEAGGMVYDTPFSSYPLTPVASDRLRLEGPSVEVTLQVLPADESRPSLELSVEGRGQIRHLEPIELATPAPAEVAGYAGDYDCEELATTVRVTAEDATLRFGHVDPHAEPFDAPLTPTLPDAFGGGGLTLEFERGGDGPPEALRLHYGRVRNLLCTPAGR